jgi:hypothetical protein
VQRIAKTPLHAASVGPAPAIGFMISPVCEAESVRRGRPLGDVFAIFANKNAISRSYYAP